MPENPVYRLNQLYKLFCDGAISRRELVRRASIFGLSAASLSVFLRAVPTDAQDASPPAGGVQSITREEYQQQLDEWWTEREEPANEGGTVVMGDNATSNLTTTNAIFANNTPTTDVIVGLVFESLVVSSPIDGQFVPALADRWEIAEDGRTYTFYLNENATWHDGAPVTADDVVFSFDAQSDPATGSSYTASFTGVVESYNAIDEKTVQVFAADPFAQVVFLGNAYCPILPKHIWEGIPVDEWQSDPGSTGADPARVVGSGPFVFQEINEDEGAATFARNENYYNGPPVIDTFIFQVWPDDTAGVEALRAGDIDFYQNVPPADVEGLQAEEPLDVALYDTYSFNWYGYNLDPEKTSLFQDVQTRQALFYALDRQSMVDNIMRGYATLAHGTQPTLSMAYAPDQIATIYSFDLERARELLAEADWADADGDGIVERDENLFQFEIMYPSGFADYEQVVASMQEAWREIGVDATPNPVDFDSVLVPALTQNFDYDLCLLGFNWDVTADQSAMFATDQYRQGFNAMKYSNPEYDELAAQANRELDPEARRQLLIEASNIINEDLPVGILWFRQDRTAYDVRLHNFTPNGVSLLWSLPYVWVEE